MKRCIDMPPEAIHERCIGKFTQEPSIWTIPRDYPFVQNGTLIRDEKHPRLVIKSMTEYLLHDEAWRGGKNGQYKYEEYTFEEDDIPCDAGGLRRELIHNFADIIDRIIFKIVYRRPFGAAMRINCFGTGWVIEAHGEVLCLTKMTGPMRYTSTFLLFDDIKKDQNVLKMFMSEIISLSFTYYKESEDGEYYNTFIDKDYLGSFFDEATDRYSSEELQHVLVKRIRKLYDACLDYDFNNFRKKDFEYTVLKDKPLSWKLEYVI